jgi:hypothetical protein
MVYFVIGLILGLIVMAIICEKAHRQELTEMRDKMVRDRQYHYDVVTALENELRKVKSDGKEKQ